MLTLTCSVGGKLKVCLINLLKKGLGSSFKIALNFLYKLWDYKLQRVNNCCGTKDAERIPISDLFSMGAACPQPIYQFSLWENLEPFSRALLYRGGI